MPNWRDQDAGEPAEETRWPRGDARTRRSTRDDRLRGRHRDHHDRRSRPSDEARLRSNSAPARGTSRDSEVTGDEGVFTGNDPRVVHVSSINWSEWTKEYHHCVNRDPDIYPRLATVKRQILQRFPDRSSTSDAIRKHSQLQWDLKLSKSLSYELRHNRDLPKDAGGWASLPDLMSFNRSICQTANIPGLLAFCLQTNDKGRFQLEFRPSGDGTAEIPWLRVHQGHSQEVRDQIDPALAADRPLQESELPALAVHATHLKNLDSIMKVGLNNGASSRAQVHFATTLPTSQVDASHTSGVVKGDIWIFLDVHKAWEEYGDNMTMTSNGVLLFPKKQSVMPRLFLHVIDIKKDPDVSFHHP